MGNDNAEVAPDVLNMFEEMTFRQALPGIGHEAFLEEPVVHVDWFPHLADVQQKVARARSKAEEGRSKDW